MQSRQLALNSRRNRLKIEGVELPDANARARDRYRGSRPIRRKPRPAKYGRFAGAGTLQNLTLRTPQNPTSRWAVRDRGASGNFRSGRLKSEPSPVRNLIKPNIAEAFSGPVRAGARDRYMAAWLSSMAMMATPFDRSEFYGLAAKQTADEIRTKSPRQGASIMQVAHLRERPANFVIASS